jgi:hypothetical protein
VGIGGPVGSGTTALMEALCKALHDRYDACAIGPAELAGAGVAADGPETGLHQLGPEAGGRRRGNVQAFPPQTIFISTEQLS